MAPTGNGFRIQPEDVRKRGKRVVELADDMEQSVSSLSGTSEVVVGYTQGLNCGKTLADCEKAWEEATDLLLAKIATAGDNLQLSADDYAKCDDEVAANLQPR